MLASAAPAFLAFLGIAVGILVGRLNAGST
jgi:hypothetical protein